MSGLASLRRKIWLSPRDLRRDAGPVEDLQPADFGAFADLRYDAKARRDWPLLVLASAGQGVAISAPLLLLAGFSFGVAMTIAACAAAGALFAAARALACTKCARDWALPLHGELVSGLLHAPPEPFRRPTELHGVRLDHRLRARGLLAAAPARIVAALAVSAVPVGLPLWLVAGDPLLAGAMALALAGTMAGAFTAELRARGDSRRDDRARLAFDRNVDQLVRLWPSLREHEATRPLRAAMGRPGFVRRAALRMRRGAEQRWISDLALLAVLLAGAMLFSGAGLPFLIVCSWGLAAAAYLGGSIGSQLGVIAWAKPHAALLDRWLGAGSRPSGRHDRIRSIMLHDVGYHYPRGDAPVLADINIEVRSGDIIALQSPSGTGKTTLLRLLMGLIEPSCGRALVNDVDMTEAAFRHRISAVFQDETVGAGTIRQAISGGSAVPLDALWEAAALVGIDEAIRALPMQMQTLVVEGPFPRSLLAPMLIARAIARQPDVLVLDEALGALPIERAAGLLHAMRERGVAVLFASHDPALVELADRVISLGPLPHPPST